jgi:hypothetical protein
MSLSYPTDCLAFHQARAFSVARSLQNRPTAEIAKQMLDWAPFKGTKVIPEVAAIKFYGLNHAFSMVTKRRSPVECMTPIEQQITEMYYREAAQIGLRSFYYLLLITTREARHLHDKSDMAKKYGPTYGKDVMGYIGSVPDSPTQAVEMFTASPPPGRLGDYARALSTVFHYGKWGHAYGGKAWGNIADCMRSFIEGHTSLEQMTDTVFTLAHNCGPIYNKGVLFSNYGNRLLNILDVQASGQMPNGILNPANNGDSVFSEYRAKLGTAFNNLMVDAGREFPEFTAPIDWFKVAALGGKQSYSGWMHEQKMAGIKSPYEDQVILAKPENPWAGKKKSPHPKLTNGNGLPPTAAMLAPGLYYPKFARAA